MSLNRAAKTLATETAYVPAKEEQDEDEDGGGGGNSEEDSEEFVGDEQNNLYSQAARRIL